MCILLFNVKVFALQAWKKKTFFTLSIMAQIVHKWKNVNYVMSVSRLWSPLVTVIHVVIKENDNGWKGLAKK